MDLKNTKELTKLIAFARKNGITRIKEGEVEIDIAPQALFPESAYKKKQTEIETPETPFNEADALFWSSAGIPESILEGTNG